MSLSRRYAAAMNSTIRHAQPPASRTPRAAPVPVNCAPRPASAELKIIPMIMGHRGYGGFTTQDPGGGLDLDGRP